MARPRFSSPLKPVPKRVRSKRMTMSGTTSDAAEDLHELPSPTKPNEHGTFHAIDSNPLEGVSSESLQEMPRRELMALCKRLGLKAIGKNVALIARIEALLPPPPCTRSSSSAVSESQTISREEWDNSIVDYEQDQIPDKWKSQQPQIEPQSNFDSSFNPFQSESQHYNEDNQLSIVDRGSSDSEQSFASSGTEDQDVTRDEVSVEQEPHPRPEAKFNPSDEEMATESDGEDEVGSDASHNEQQIPIEQKAEAQKLGSDEEPQGPEESEPEAETPATDHSYNSTQDEQKVQEMQEDLQASSTEGALEPVAFVAEQTSQSFSQDLRQMFATPAVSRTQPTRSPILSPLRNVFSPFRTISARSQQTSFPAPDRESVGGSARRAATIPASRSVPGEATPQGSSSITPAKDDVGDGSSFFVHANSPQVTNTPKASTRHGPVVSSTPNAQATPGPRPTSPMSTPQAFNANSPQPQVEGTPKASTHRKSVGFIAPKAQATPQPRAITAATPKASYPQENPRVPVPASCPPKKAPSSLANLTAPRSRKSMPGAWSFGPLASQPKPEQAAASLEQPKTKQPDEPMAATPTNFAIPLNTMMAQASPAAQVPSPAAPSPVAAVPQSTPGPSTEQCTPISASKSTVPTATRASFSNVAAKVLAEMHARLARASPSKDATSTAEASAQDQVPAFPSSQHKLTGAPLAKAGWTAPPPKQSSVSAKFAAAHEAQFRKMASIAAVVRRPAVGGANLKRMRSASGNSTVAHASGEGTSTDARPTKRARPTEPARSVRSSAATSRPPGGGTGTSRAAARAGGASIPPATSRVASTARLSTIAGPSGRATVPVARTTANRPTRTELLRAQSVANRTPSINTTRGPAPTTKFDPTRRQTVVPRPPGPSAVKPSFNRTSTTVRKSTVPRASSSTMATRSPLKADKGLSIREARIRALRASTTSTAQGTTTAGARTGLRSQNGIGSSNASVPPGARIIKPIPKRRATTITAAPTPQSNDTQCTKQQSFTLNRPRFTLAAVSEQTNSVPPSEQLWQPKPRAKPAVSTTTKTPCPTSAQPKSVTNQSTYARLGSGTSRGQVAATRASDEAKVAARREAMAARARARWAAKHARN